MAVARINRIATLLGGLFLLFAAPQANAFSGSGSGTSGSPYLITTCAQLAEMENARSSYYTLSNNIDCLGYGAFTPIGQGGSFTGTLDGGGYTISNLTITRTTTNTGLFRSTSNATIKNFTLSNAAISSTQYFVGGITGFDNGSTFSKIGISSSTISSSYSGGVFMGGIIGAWWGSGATTTISDSYVASTTISDASGSRIGGLIGDIDAAGSMRTVINRSYFSGTITGSSTVGGLVGFYYNGGTAELLYINDSFSVATLTPGGSSAGGIIGYLYNSNYYTLTNTWYDGKGGTALKCGYSGYTIAGCTAVNTDNTAPNYFKNSSSTAPMSSWSFPSVWTVTSDYPVLSAPDTTTPTTPGVPTVTTPSSNPLPSLTWTASTDAGGLAATPYTLQWSTTADFSGTVYSSSTATNAFTATTALADGTWYYRVRATDAAGNSSAYATSSAITIDTTVQATGYYDPQRVRKLTALAVKIFLSANPANVTPASQASVGVTASVSGRTLDWRELTLHLEYGRCGGNKWLPIRRGTGDVRFSADVTNDIFFTNADSNVHEGMQTSWVFPVMIASEANDTYCIRTTNDNGPHVDTSATAQFNVTPPPPSVSVTTAAVPKNPETIIALSTQPEQKQAGKRTLTPPERKLGKQLKAGSRGRDVRVLQKFLNANGFVLDESGPGSNGQETPYFGPLTKKALIQFQSEFGLESGEGDMGPRTRAFINDIPAP